MTLDDFIKKYDGKFVEANDPSALNQCMDLITQYRLDILHTPAFGVVKAKDVFDAASSDIYDKFKNTATSKPRAGDIIIWDIGTVGHIAIVKQADMNKFVSFDQNWPTGSPCVFVNHDYKRVIGWIRKKGDEVTEEECQKRIEEALKGKYDENHMRELLGHAFRKQREVLLGSLDTQGLQNDVDFRYSQISEGSQSAFADQFEDYMKATDLQWIPAKDVKKKIDELERDLDEQAGLCDQRVENEIKKACKNCPKVEVVRYETIWEFIKRKAGIK